MITQDITPNDLAQLIATMEPTDKPNTWISRPNDDPRILCHTPNNGLWMLYQFPLDLDTITSFEIC